MSGLKSKRTRICRNHFDLSTGMGGSRQLTNKSHRDCSQTRKNRREIVKKPFDHVMVHVEEAQVTSEMRKSLSARKSGGTQMKILIAQEMSKELECKRNQPNVVARLMGLDEAFPAHQPVLNSEGRFEKNGRPSRVTLARALQNCHQREDDYFSQSRPCEVRSPAHENEDIDVYEACHFKDHPLHKGRHNDVQNEMRMALVRQKFMEAKRLVTDERLLQSREFQDALEVLSSNRDLFLKFLEEPNSLFSKHLKGLDSTPAAPQPKRIIVLKPSRALEVKGDTQVKQQQCVAADEVGWGMDRLRRSSCTAQPTRIVVLKPSPRKRNDAKPMVMPYISSPELMEKDETIGSREAENAITWQMRESACSIRRDESLLSSILSNGYVGDESSFTRSEKDGNFSESEIPSPASRHSCDDSNTIGSPCSLSSFSRASCSPEPSVIREAKKRLSERWLLVASSANCQEKGEVQKSSSTLGEMLAISEVKKEATIVWRLTASSSRSCGGEEDLTVSSATSSFCQTKDGDTVERSPGNLSRSKSLPISYASEKMGLISDVSHTLAQEHIVASDSAKSKGGRSLLKGKFSSLFSSRNKKSGKESSVSSAFAVSSADVGDGGDAEEESVKVHSLASVKGSSKNGTISLRVLLSIDKASTPDGLGDNPSLSDKLGENRNQPRPTSVLDSPSEDHAPNTTPNSSETQNAGRSCKIVAAPVESVDRTLSRDNANLDVSSPDSSNIVDDEERRRHSFVQSILSAAGLDKSPSFARWHSVDCPLNPTLLDKFVDRKDGDANQTLLFDCINSALLQIGGSRKKVLSQASMGEEVWVIVRDWYSRTDEPSEIDDFNAMLDMMLAREVGGKGWAEAMQSESDEVVKMISGQVFGELVREAFADLTV